MEVKEIKKDNGITLKVTGRIDTNTSSALQSEILKVLQKTDMLTVDLEEVSYVSSAGLRTFLIAQKTVAAKGQKVSIINASKMIRDLFASSGFDKLLDIK